MLSVSGSRDEEVLVNIASNFQWHGVETKRQGVGHFKQAKQAEPFYNLCLRQYSEKIT